MIRYIRDNTGEPIGEYEVLIDEPREVYVDEKLIDNTVNLDSQTENALNNVIDDFEEGFNNVKDGYEILSTPKFTVKRKIDNIIYY